MANLLKTFGKGCLYILVLPVLLVILSFYAVLGIVMFVLVAIRAGILFFTGRNFGELPEDIKARAILEGNEEEEAKPAEPEVQKVEAPTADFVSSYYMPLDQSTPAPKEEEKPVEEIKEGGNE